MNQVAPPDGGPSAGRHLVFALLSISMLSFIMQFGMVAVSLGELTTDLHAPLRWGQWVLTIFMIGQVISLPVAGRMSERFGARSVFAFGFGVFAAASFVCAIAPNIAVLVVGRAFQGAAGGGLMPSGTSLIGEVYGAGRTKAIALYTSLMPFGAVLGPTVGGLIVEHLGWRWTFAFNAPLGAVVCLAGLLVLPPGARRPVQRLDLLGIGLIGVTITSLVLALTELGQRNATPNYALVGGAAAVFAGALIVLVRHELRAPQPVIDLDLLRRREFASVNALSFCFGMAWIGVATLIPLYAQEEYGLSVAESGAIMSPRAIAMVVVSSLSALAIGRTGFRRPLAFGSLGIAGALFFLSRGLHDVGVVGLSVPDFWWLLVVVTSAGVFFGFVNPSMNNAGLELAPDRIAAIVGLRGMFQTLGGTIGVSLVVLLASRADTIASGLQVGFTAQAAVLVASLIFLLGVPEMNSGRLPEPSREPSSVSGTRASPRRIQLAGGSSDGPGGPDSMDS